MNFQLQLKTVLLVVGAVASLDSQATCWPDLVEEQAGVELALDRRNFDAEKLAAERAKLRHLLGSCHEEAEFFYSPPDDGLTPKHSYSLIEIAIAADDPELTLQLIEQLRQSHFVEPSDLLISRQYVNWAAHLESAKAMKALLDTGVYLTAEPSQSADTALLVSRAFTDSGLEIIRMLVDSGASIEAAVGGSPTAAQYAARDGDLAKVQCLYSMGATLPPSSVVEEAIAQDSMFHSKDALEATRKFLADDEKEIPESVAKICSSHYR